MSMALMEHSAIPTGGRMWTYRVGYQAYVPVLLTMSFDGAPPLTIRADDRAACWFAVAGLDALTIRSATTSLSDGAHSVSFPDPVVPHIDVTDRIAATSIAGAVSHLLGTTPPRPLRLAVAYECNAIATPVLLAPEVVVDADAIAAIESTIRDWARDTNAARDGEFVFDISDASILRFRYISVPFGTLVPEMTPQIERL